MGNPRKVLKKEAWRENVQPLRIWKNANFTKFQRPKKHQPQKWPEHSLQPSQGDETGIYHLANKRVLASSSACLYPRLETTEQCQSGNPATCEHHWTTHLATRNHFTWQAVTRRNQVVKRYLYAFQYERERLVMVMDMTWCIIIVSFHKNISFCWCLKHKLPYFFTQSPRAIQSGGSPLSTLQL